VSAGPVISFLSDYGLADGFVGVCHGVIARGCPEARVIDLSHGIASHDVRAGALVLARALAFLPMGVHLADVTDGVGGIRGPRRAVAITCGDGQRLVGPDNGLLWPAMQAAGGVVAAVDLAGSPLALAPVSATFPGRDLLAPVAAGLAGGLALERVGHPIDASSVQTLALPESGLDLDGGGLVAHVLSVDRFGNLELDATPAQLTALGLQVGDEVTLTVDEHAAPTRVRWGRTFADVGAGELVLFEDPQRQLALAVNRASAAARLGLGVDDTVRVSGP
jgi:S-adenosylmethionine hydrolase